MMLSAKPCSLGGETVSCGHTYNCDWCHQTVCEDCVSGCYVPQCGETICRSCRADHDQQEHPVEDDPFDEGED